jgi:hypothetical protein
MEPPREAEEDELLENLLDGTTDADVEGETDWGPDVGAEIIEPYDPADDSTAG